MARDLGQVWGVPFGTSVEELRRRFSGLPAKRRTQDRHTYYTFGSDEKPIDELVRWVTVAASEEHGAYKITAGFKPGASIMERAVQRLEAEYGPPQGDSGGGPEWFDAEHRIMAAGDEDAAFVDGFVISVWAPSFAEKSAKEAEIQELLDEFDADEEQDKDLGVNKSTSDTLGLVGIFEDFFLHKIRDGLAATGQKLTPEERQALRTPITSKNMMELGVELDLQALQAKCEHALTTAYANDTTGPNKRRAASEWRSNNENLYQYSERAISGIVQNWYLKVGRAQEKQATGCFAMALLLVGAAAGVVEVVQRLVA